MIYDLGNGYIMRWDEYYQDWIIEERHIEFEITTSDSTGCDT